MTANYLQMLEDAHEKHIYVQEVLYDKLFNAEIDKILISVIFEQNDEKTRSLVRSKIRERFIDLLEELHQIRSPYIIDGLVVICDGTNNKNDVIEKGSLRAGVFIYNKLDIYNPKKIHKEIGVGGIHHVC